MDSHTNLLTDDIVYKTRGIGRKSAWHYEDFMGTMIYVIDKIDYVDFLNEVDFEGRGILSSFEQNPETSEWAVNICSALGINYKARLLFAQNQNVEKVFITLKGSSDGFTEEQADTIVESLALILKDRGIPSTTTTNRMVLPSSYEAETGNIFARSIEGTLRLNGIYCPSNGNAILRASQNPLMADKYVFDNILNNTPNTIVEHGAVKKKISRKAGTTKRGKQRVRASYNVSIADLQANGWIAKNAKIRFTIENKCSIRLMAKGIIEVNGKRYITPSSAGQAIYATLGNTTKCKSAYRQFEVQTNSGEWKSLESLRKTYVSAGQPNLQKVVIKASSRSDVTVADIIAADILPTRNITIDFVKKGIKGSAIIDDEGNIIYNGQSYKSPSAAANAVIDASGQTSVRYRDGWAGWTLIDELGVERSLGYYRAIAE